MKMYVANCTNQVQAFLYRAPGTKSNRNQPIDIGRQVQISGDLNTKDIEAIVEQHSKYGMVAVDEIDRTKAFVGVCYSIDKPVPIEKIKRAAEHNKGVLIEAGRENRKLAAVAVNNEVEKQAPGALNSLELSIEEQESKDGRDREVSENITVDKTATPGTSSKPTKGGSRK